MLVETPAKQITKMLRQFLYEGNYFRSLNVNERENDGHTSNA